MIMRKYYFIAGILFLMTACAVSNKFQPDEKNISSMQQKIPGITMEYLKEGMIIYKKTCSSCHQLYVPSAFTRPQWEKTLVEMFPKAKIVDEPSQKKVRDYLYAMLK
jgi:hypothetical protein